ncbi:MAG: hypothetical protein KDB80_03980 [Planctomycetes bacterium]|nr:hypothetical protein [Planctomycetota bacterium]
MRFELRHAVRTVLLPAASIFCLAAVALEIQRPPFALGDARIDFLWGDLEALTSVVALGLPWLWVASRGEVGALRLSSPAPAALGMSLAVMAAGLMAIVAAATSGLLTEYTLHRMFEFERAIQLGTRVAIAFVPLAALAPGLAELRLSSPMAALVWSALSVGSIGLFGLGVPLPLDRLLAGSGFPSATVCLASALATVAGVILSSSVVARARLR